jgi:hypothetical protein
MEIVNGFQCKNCTDVDYAKKHIDPAHPKDGPYGVNAKNDPARVGKPRDPAVQFGGALAAFGGNALSLSPAPPSVPSSGSVLNLSV